MTDGLSSQTLWGGDQTRFFFELTPERVLAAVESSGVQCTGRCMALNSFENRVYSVELEGEKQYRVAKFYRPGRWSREQIVEEHEFLLDLQTAEIPVIAPERFQNGNTLQTMDCGIFFALFPRVGGRAPDELRDEQLRRIGRLLGRIHNVGAAKKAEHRLALGPDTYGRANLSFLMKEGWLPVEFAARYENAARAIFSWCDQNFDAVSTHRIHGDCHLGNLLWNQEGPFFLDFDDMVRGPAVQDLWLLLPGRDAEARRQREVLLEGYEDMRVFDHGSLRLIEALRALRFVHYAAWIARRWKDPAFPKAFPQFGTHQYWQREVEDLEEQLRLIS